MITRSNYAWTAKGIGMNGGYVYYAFPNTSSVSTSEAFASATFAGPLAPTVAVNYDVNVAGACYAAFSTGYGCKCKMPGSKAKTEVLNLSAKLAVSSAAYNKFWYGVDQAAVSDFCLGAAMPFAMGGKATLTPSISYSMVIDSQLRDSLSGMGSSRIISSVPWTWLTHSSRSPSEFNAFRYALYFGRKL